MTEPANTDALDIRRAAMDLLARREHSYQELRAKLARRFGQADMVEQQLQALNEENLQCDRRFCEIFVRSKCRKGQGPRRISQELKQRGIDDELVQTALWSADIDWLSIAQQAYAKRFGTEAAGDARERARRARFLQYRGFDFDLIKQLLDN